MENRKNLCAMIPESLYAKVGEEKDQLNLTLSQYVEKVLNEHFVLQMILSDKSRNLMQKNAVAVKAAAAFLYNCTF